MVEPVVGDGGDSLSTDVFLFSSEREHKKKGTVCGLF